MSPCPPLRELILVPPDHVIKMAQPLKFSVRRSQAGMIGALGLLVWLDAAVVSAGP
jgi:hypothetical protein